MKTIIAVLCLTLSGCAPIAKQFLPSLDHCAEVQYVRKGQQFAVFFSDCRL